MELHKVTRRRYDCIGGESKIPSSITDCHNMRLDRTLRCRCGDAAGDSGSKAGDSSDGQERRLGEKHFRSGVFRLKNISEWL